MSDSYVMPRRAPHQIQPADESQRNRHDNRNNSLSCAYSYNCTRRIVQALCHSLTLYSRRGEAATSRRATSMGVGKDRLSMKSESAIPLTAAGFYPSARGARFADTSLSTNREGAYSPRDLRHHRVVRRHRLSRAEDVSKFIAPASGIQSAKRRSLLTRLSASRPSFHAAPSPR